MVLIDDQPHPFRFDDTEAIQLAPVQEHLRGVHSPLGRDELTAE